MDYPHIYIVYKNIILLILECKKLQLKSSKTTDFAKNILIDICDKKRQN